MRILKNLLGSAIVGITALCVLYVLAPYTGVAVPLCRLSLAMAAALGVPGVTLILLLQML